MSWSLGTDGGTKADEFSEKFQRRGARAGVIFNPKIYIAAFGLLYRTLNREFLEKLQYKFTKMRGWGGVSKAVWNFSENSSVLVPPPVPYLEGILSLQSSSFVIDE